jgi:hypothetical protein
MWYILSMNTLIQQSHCIPYFKETQSPKHEQYTQAGLRAVRIMAARPQQLRSLEQ